MHKSFNPYPAKLIITNSEIITENANKPRMIGYIDLNNYSPYPKNPKIANFFKELGLADELGSGIKKIVKYTKIYSGKKPVFKDYEIFQAIISINNAFNNYLSTTELNKLLLDFIKNSQGKTRKEINDYIYPLLNENIDSMNNRVRTSLTYLKKAGLKINFGSDFKPLWKVTK